MPAPSAMSLGGMCWVKQLLKEWLPQDQLGPHGPFDQIATTPGIVRHILDNGFKEFLDRRYFQECSYPGGKGVQHTLYKNMALTHLQDLAAHAEEQGANWLRAFISKA